MAFCKYCGNELDKDGKCTCKKSEEEAKKDIMKEKKSASTEKRTVVSSSENKSKKTLVIVCVVAVLLLAGIIAGLIIHGMNAYKKPIKEMVKGINRGDTEKIVSAMYSDNAAAEIRLTKARDRGMKWDEFVEQNDKSIDTIRSSRNIKKIKVDILAKEKLDGSNLTEIEKYYSDKYDEEVKKAYRVEVKFTIKYKDNTDTQSGWITVAKVKDDGWKYTEAGSDTFDFVRDLTMF